MGWLHDLITNPFLITGVSSWFIAQVLKTIIHAIVNKKFEIERLFGDGGMPSGHSATVTSIAVITLLICGVGSFEFAVTAILAIIVCHDAMGVRLETGKQAVVINDLVDEMKQLTHKHIFEGHLKELVGHSPLQVLSGILVGVVNAFVMYNIFV